MRIGFIINPIAGMGGCVGLKGTDGPEILAEARRRGARAIAQDRAIRALIKLDPVRDSLELVTAAGNMGQTAARAAGLNAEAVGTEIAETSANHTRVAARRMVELGCALILFAGGDGTARVVHRAIGQEMPLLGIPTGVKMHSGVFATSPEAAGQLVAQLVAGDPIAYRTSEIMDIDEAALRSGRVSARLYGYSPVPYERRLLQNAKAGAPPDDDLSLDAAGHQLAAAMERGIAYVIGPGQSTKCVLKALGLKGTLLGIDLVLDRDLIGRDLAEAELLELTRDHDVRIIIGVTGGQGFLFGRGNQPISPALVRRAGTQGLIILAGMQKLSSLAERQLLVDTGDRDLDKALEGYRRVITGPGQEVIMRVRAA